MRIASSVYQLQWLSSIRRQQAELAATQEQVSTGKRINTAADDPAGAAQAILLQQGLDRLENYGANAETAQRRLGLEEGALSQSSDALNRVRELAIQAANGTQTRESRSAIAAEWRSVCRLTPSRCNPLRVSTAFHMRCIREGWMRPPRVVVKTKS